MYLILFPETDLKPKISQHKWIGSYNNIVFRYNTVFNVSDVPRYQVILAVSEYWFNNSIDGCNQRLHYIFRFPIFQFSLAFANFSLLLIDFYCYGVIITAWIISWSNLGSWKKSWSTHNSCSSTSFVRAIGMWVNKLSSNSLKST